MIPMSLKEHVAALDGRGWNLEIFDHEGQCYVYVPAIDAPTPPWDRSSYDILIAIPAVYDRGALDAFYLGLPYTHGGGTHPRVENGQVVTINDRKWRTVSWHYLDGNLHRYRSHKADQLEGHTTDAGIIAVPAEEAIV